jgi:hypothetical protein
VNSREIVALGWYETSSLPSGFFQLPLRIKVTVLAFKNQHLCISLFHLLLVLGFVGSCPELMFFGQFIVSIWNGAPGVIPTLVLVACQLTFSSY